LNYFSKNKHINGLVTYVLSEDNIKKRSRVEVSIVFKLLEKFLNDIEKNLDFYIENGVGFKFCGNESLIPSFILKKIKNLESETYG